VMPGIRVKTDNGDADAENSLIYRALIDRVQPLVVGQPPENPKYAPTVNTSFRLVTQAVTVKPGNRGAPLADVAKLHAYPIFIGPKDRDILAAAPYNAYHLGELIYYGWSIFALFASILTGLLHIFESFTFNYGIAIILLTVMVRGAMFPLSRKQAIGAQKMQKLQPELKRITEKYKNNYEQRVKAQRELFKRENYNPASGCLVLFLQLPIFIGLYKALSVDIELRQASLIPGLSWCSDLSAPDRLFPWESFMPGFITAKAGMLGLGPYFNILPVITIVLFLVHQKLFMPPPTDEQQIMQQKVMKFMMIVMGFLFFCVPSGLCIYFIASSLWGIAERKLLPKSTPDEGTATGKPGEKKRAGYRTTLPGGGDGSTADKPGRRVRERTGEAQAGRSGPRKKRRKRPRE